MMWNRFHQDQIWITKDRRVLEIATMDPDHRKNVINFLRRKAEIFAFGEYCRLMGEMIAYDRARGGLSDGVFWAFEGMLAELENGAAWMETTALMCALLRADAAYEAGLSRWRKLWRWFHYHPIVEPPLLEPEIPRATTIKEMLEISDHRS